MHTFFINTSKKNFDDYKILFDIYHENKALISIECGMSDWYNNEKGYIECVNKMSDMIDSYVELNNVFNLIIYIDLWENDVYSSIKRDMFHDNDRNACVRALHILFTHVISESIVNMLVNLGRKPQDVLIMFGEDQINDCSKVNLNNPSSPVVMKNLFKHIGLPDDNTIERIAKGIVCSDVQNKAEEFRKQVLIAGNGETIPGILESYDNDLLLWCDEIVNGANVNKANYDMFERINHTNYIETDRIKIETLSCPFDCIADKSNKSLATLTQLNVVMYILKCLEANSIYVERVASESQKCVMDFCTYDVDRLARLLNVKREIFSEKLRETESLAKSYSELELAPTLLAFDYNKFGLDKYGDKAFDLVVRDVIHKESYEENDIDTVKVNRQDKEVVIVERTGRMMFEHDEYQSINCDCDSDIADELKKDSTPEQFVKQAKIVRKHHLDYLKKLKLIIFKVLGNYAGKSKENKPALLRVGEQRYAIPNEVEDKSLEEVEKVSDKAYESMLKQYMDFCAGRQVAIEDIEEQCNWFVSRVYRIKESLRKKRGVAIGLLVALIVLYIPFLIIQYEAITDSIATKIIAFWAVVVPILMLCIVFVIAVRMQRKKYWKIWQEYSDKAKQVREANSIAVNKYDQLLSVVIPSLRWTYEYKTYVEYCAECCKIANMKIEHHRRKLFERVDAINNILDNLEYAEFGCDVDHSRTVIKSDDIDYNAPFCSGKKNESFYLIVDSKFLDSTVD